MAPSRVEPPVHVSGSPRVEPSRLPFLPAANRRVPASRAGFDSDSSDISPRALDLLASLPPGRFIFSSVFPDLRTALQAGKGWLDLFSGSRGLAKALARAAPCWILCYDLLHGEDEDLLSLTVQDEICEMFEAVAFRGFSAGPVCSSFSQAITPSWRSLEYPEGKPDLLPDQAGKVRQGNAMLKFILELIRICLRSELVYLVENPLNSWMWKQPGWGDVMSDWRRTDFLVDFCVFGAPWKKPTRLRTNGQLGGRKMRCGGTCVHRRLRGRDAVTGRSLTKLAEPYPKRLCILLAQALAQDAKWITGHRSLDLARCAKCTHARIGEAGNPGPRRRAIRPDIQLRDVPLVEPTTAALQVAIWTRFLAWVVEGAGQEAADSLTLVPEVLVEMLCAFGQVLYSTGYPLQHFRQLLATAQRRCPLCRPLLKPGWEKTGAYATQAAPPGADIRSYD